MFLAKLQMLVPPPSEPVHTVDASDPASIAIGGDSISLPRDFLAYAAAYGSGTWCNGYLYIESPSAPIYAEFVRMALDALWSSHEKGRFSDAVFPESGGLYPWGRDIDGSILVWSMVGSPEEWPIAVLEHGGGVESFGMCMTEFLYRSLVNDVAPRVWQVEPFTSEEWTFHTPAGQD